MGDQIRIPLVVITFFPFLFQGDIKDCRTVILVYYVVSSIYQLFVPRAIMAEFMCLHYRVNKQRHTSFEFSSILSVVDLSKHLITAGIIGKFIHLVNFVTFSVFFFFFGNRVWLNLYKRALSGHELLSIFLKETSIITGSFHL